MDNIRIKREIAESIIVSPLGVLAADSKGRLVEEEKCPVRTDFQRDIDRITHSKAFRRLKHKTQVFLQPEGDHYRTRLTHTLEVSRIARTISRALELNEDLTEAIALGHDLGHTAFGHAGERALNELMAGHGGFRHYDQSLRVVDKLEKDGAGLNLTFEVRDGIVRHTTDPLAATLEGQVVRLSDRVAYINHDIDDAIRAGILSNDDIPTSISDVIGTRHSQRIDSITRNIIEHSFGKPKLSMSDEMAEAVEAFHNFMFERVYRNPTAKGEESKVFGIFEGLFTYYAKNPGKMPDDYMKIVDEEGIEVAVCDYISGMTDPYALKCFSDIYIPSAWSVY